MELLATSNMSEVKSEHKVCFGASLRLTKVGCKIQGGYREREKGQGTDKRTEVLVSNILLGLLWCIVVPVPIVQNKASVWVNCLLSHLLIPHFLWTNKMDPLHVLFIQQLAQTYWPWERTI